MKKVQKSTLKNQTSSFHSKSKRQTSTPKKAKTSMIQVKPLLNNSLQAISPTSTVNMKIKKSSPFDQIFSHQTSFNRLICKQNSFKPSPEKQTNRFNEQIRQIFNKSDLANKTQNYQFIKQFLLQSNKLFYDHMRRQNKKMKIKLKQELYQYIQGIKTQIMQNIKVQMKTQITPKGIQQMKQRIRELNTTIIQQKFKIQQIVHKTSRQIQQINSKQLQRIQQTIVIFNQRLQQQSQLIDLDCFSCFSDKLSEVIDKYNQNFCAVNYNVDSLAEMIKEIITVMKSMKGKRSQRGKSQQSPSICTAKFTSLEV